jgi:hypothetical protein
LQREIEHEIQSLKEPFEQLMEDCMWEDWKKAESNWSLGYNGLLACTQRQNGKNAWDKEVEDAKLRKTWVRIDTAVEKQN